MPSSPLPAEAIEMLRRPNPAVMATVRPDGQPVSVATWYLWQEGRILLNMDARRKRLEHLEQNPQVSLTVLDSESWYTHVSLQGRIEQLVEDPDLTNIDRLAQHYIGQPYFNRENVRISAWMGVEHWHAWGQLKNLG